MFVTLTFLALLIEALVGYPDWLVQSIGHPVIWMGRLIGLFDNALNLDRKSPASRRAAGVVSLFLVMGVVGGLAYVLEQSLLWLPLGAAIAAVPASTLMVAVPACVNNCRFAFPPLSA